MALNTHTLLWCFRSSLTLALMEDSGWYLANYTNSRMSPWGLGSGCQFVDDLCLKVNDAGETIIPDYSKVRSSALERAGCSPSIVSRVACRNILYCKRAIFAIKEQQRVAIRNSRTNLRARF
jgi:Leishmanolysin